MRFMSKRNNPRCGDCVHRNVCISRKRWIEWHDTFSYLDTYEGFEKFIGEHCHEFKK